MASTRFSSDPARIFSNLNMLTNSGKYALNTPGPGVYMSYNEDVFTRLQHWGANADKNALDIENDLRGMTKPLATKDPFVNEYKAKSPGQISGGMYPTQQPYTDQSRATHPAWMYRDLEQPRWEQLWLDPLHEIEPKFNTNVNTRILEKDYFVPTLPNIPLQS